MKEFKPGDLVKHSTLLGKLYRGYGIVIDVHPKDWTFTGTILCAWCDGKRSWVHKGQLQLIAKGQNGELS